MNYLYQLRAMQNLLLYGIRADSFLSSMVGGGGGHNDFWLFFEVGDILSWCKLPVGH